MEPKIDLNFYNNIPRKRMSAGLLILDENSRLLLVHPTYRDDTWNLPGGIVEEDESPKAAGEREAKEEIGMDIRAGKMLAADYYHNSLGKGDAIHFVFDGGTISEAQLKKSVVLQKGELDNWGLFALDEALKLLKPNLQKRYGLAFQARLSGQMFYLENSKIAA